MILQFEVASHLSCACLHLVGTQIGIFFKICKIIEGSYVITHAVIDFPC